MEQDKVNRVTTADKPNESFGQWWSQARPTKTIVFWSWVGSIILTMVIGFAWGGWVTGSTAQKMAEVMVEEAIVQRLTPICIVQFNQDPGKEQKLKELQEVRGYQRTAYVKEQGWATMPGEEEADSKVVSECVKLLMLIEQ
jgi:hypothetical protein